jgi:glucosamine 6-phosphate synthetase-like amidotransferase/phosphosugar isomerase protein
MCGVFGFISSDGQGPHVARLRRIALVTQTRGDHAFGLAWVNVDGRMHVFKRSGPARAWLDELDECRSAVALVGHCRWATHGSPLDNRNNHPHAAGRGWLVHNGVIRNHAELIAECGLKTQSECDSEVLGLLMAQRPGPLVQRSTWAANLCEGDMAILGLWRRPARLVVVRRGKPLHFGRSRDGTYFASLPQGLPGSILPVADCSATVLTYPDCTMNTVAS